MCDVCLDLMDKLATSFFRLINQIDLNEYTDKEIEEWYKLIDSADDHWDSHH
jgi:hypothetical protein